MTYEALTLIIEHYNITMSVSPTMYRTMINVDSDRWRVITVIGIMWIISSPKNIITSSRVLWTATVWRGVLWSKCFSHTDSSSSNLVRSDIFFECTKILQFYSVVSSLMPTHCFQQIFKGRSHQWECFGLKGDFEREKIVRRRTRAEEKGPISLADEFTSLTCSAVSPEIKIGQIFVWVKSLL